MHFVSKGCVPPLPTYYYINAGDIVIDLSDPVIDLSDPVNTQTLNVSEGNDGTLQERSICVLVPSDLSTNALQIMVSPTSTATGKHLL